MFGTFHAPLRSAAISAVVTVAGPRGRARLVLRRGCIAHVETMRAMNGGERRGAGRRASLTARNEPRCTMWHAARSSDIAALISTERRILSITITRAPVGRARGRAHPRGAHARFARAGARARARTAGPDLTTLMRYGPG